VEALTIDAPRWRRDLIAGLSAAAVAAAAVGCGSDMQSSPAAQRQVLKVTLTDNGCSPKRLAARSGQMTFVVSNGGTKRLSELEVLKSNGVKLGEKEHIVGAATGSFTLRLGPGHYILACPLPEGGGNGALVVTGKRIATRARG
jgi:iron uptake system component EfeO